MHPRHPVAGQMQHHERPGGQQHQDSPDDHPAGHRTRFRHHGYKYVPDVAAALTAWQEREIGRHLQRLRTIAQESPPESRLSDVLLAYARLRRHRHGDDDDDALHGTIRLAPAESELTALVQEIIDNDTRAGTTRTDLSPQELAAYAVGAIGAAAALPDTTAVSRLATLVVATIRQDAEE